MADTEVWSLGGPIATPAAGDRVPIATGPSAGGYSPRDAFCYRDSVGVYRIGAQLTVGAANPNYLLNVAQSNPGRGILADIANTDAAPNGAQISFTQNGITNNAFGMVPGVADMAIYKDRNAGADGTELWRWEAGGTYRPGGDNTQDLAASGKRIANSYFGSSPTITSDATQKQARATAEPTAEEIAWAHALRPRVYQMIDAIALKGEGSARLHFGVFAQEVYQAGIAAGVADPLRYGFIGRDAITRTETVMVPGRRQKMTVKPVVETAVEIIEGRAVMTSCTVNRDAPDFVEMPIYDESGALVMISEVEIGEGGESIVRQVPMMHREPVMEAVEIEQASEVPVLNDEGQPEYIWNVRYDELVMFLWFCGVFGADPA